MASGGNSTVILLHSLTPRQGEQNLDPEPRQALIGHSLNVSTLEYSVKRQKLISGSWDKTARIWSRSSTKQENGQGWECEIVLEEHEEAVWGVLAIDSGPSDGCWLTSSGTFPIGFFCHL
jgi:WD40 repeat protein